MSTHVNQLKFPGTPRKQPSRGWGLELNMGLCEEGEWVWISQKVRYVSSKPTKEEYLLYSLYDIPPKEILLLLCVRFSIGTHACISLPSKYGELFDGT